VRAPGEQQRFKTVPPIFVNIAATTFKADVAARVEKLKLHRQYIAFLGLAAHGPAILVLAKAQASAHVVDRDNPSHDVVLSDVQ
jgi:hypothetical protein